MSNVTGSSLLALAICGFAAAADAQTAGLPQTGEIRPAEDIGTSANQNDGSQQNGEIVVTGTRLSTSGFNQPTPVTVIGAELVQQRASSNLAETLTELPAFRNSNGSNQSQRTSTNITGAQNTIDLRGLGPQRTLLLVNGRRHVPTNSTGSVDLSMIPSGLVERVDVVTGGASAAYGSDAVAGVANIVLKRRTTGLEISAVNAISGQGDNFEFQANLGYGTDFADGRGRFLVGGEYSTSKGIGTIYSREWGRLEPGNSATPIAFGANRPAGTPAVGFLPNVEYATLTPGSVINAARTANGTSVTALNQIAFNKDGSLYTLVRGKVYSSLMAGVTTNYGATPLSNYPLRVPQDRVVVFGSAGYDLKDDVEIFAEAEYGKFKINTFSNFHQSALFTIRSSNPFIPDELRTRMAQLNVTEIDIGRLDSDWGGLRLDGEITSRRFVGGLRGKVFNDWDWEIYGQYGRTDLHDERFAAKDANLAAAVYAVTDANGQVVCGALASNPNFAANRLTAIVKPANVLPGCFPFTPFGQRNSQAAIDYVTGTEITDTKIEQQVYAASISGSPFSTWAGAVQTAFGGEIRRESIRNTADPLQVQGIYQSGNQRNWNGSTLVKEGFVEIGVPLARDVSLIKALDLNGAIRRTDYRLSGSVTTWKVGTTWDVADELRFRATRSRDIRAPSLSELFLQSGTVASGTTVTNPFNGASGRLPTTSNGFTGLRPERADTFTTGVVLQSPPSFLPGLRFSVDYYNIKVSDVISSVSGSLIATVGSQILQRCYAGQQDYCALITLDNTAYGIANVNLTNYNQASLETDGIDIELSYRVPLGSGALTLRALANNTRHFKRVENPAANGQAIEYAGTSQLGGSPKWSGNVTVGYQQGGFNAGVQVKAFTGIKYSPDYIGPDEAGYDPAAPNSINIGRFPSMAYVNLNASYEVKMSGRSMQLFGIVNNLFDRDPPLLAVAALNSGGNPYDFVGINFKAGVRINW